MKKQILLADDDESVRKMVARVLEVAGYGVALANSGLEALARLGDQPPDLVMVDLPRPNEEGWAICQRMRRANSPVPVIVMTAWPNQAEQAVQRGINALMEKPLDLPLLLQTIEGLLGDAERERTPVLSEPRFT